MGIRVSISAHDQRILARMEREIAKAHRRAAGPAFSVLCSSLLLLTGLLVNLIVVTVLGAFAVAIGVVATAQLYRSVRRADIACSDDEAEAHAGVGVPTDHRGLGE
jgi:hypothetical protein